MTHSHLRINLLINKGLLITFFSKDKIWLNSKIKLFIKWLISIVIIQLHSIQLMWAQLDRRKSWFLQQSKLRYLITLATALKNKEHIPSNQASLHRWTRLKSLTPVTPRQSQVLNYRTLDKNFICNQGRIKVNLMKFKGYKIAWE